ncbi:putative transporter [Lachnellula arida]|uniref:Putative transporter n=1 Tax=Lachnellula arida TaxID=1316785 RepID=A0A8T9BAS4_9HELO|nr:putative transporter [Lachnellula arida]
MASSDPEKHISHSPATSDNDISPASAAQVDDEYQTYKNAREIEADPAELKRVLRKIDYRIVPILFVTYLLQYLDKNSINFASVYGLKKGTHIDDSQYSWLASIFYFGYLGAQFPAGYLLQRLPMGKFLSLSTIAWGIILITTPACKNFGGIATNRFLLGVVEAIVNPGFVLVMSMWYSSAEQPLRLEIYYCTNGIATMFGGLIGYAVGHITTGLPQWMYVFLIFGSVSIAWGIVSLIILPDLPSTAKFLTEHERLVAVNRVAANRQGVKNKHFSKYQAIQTAKDPKTWILFIMAIGAQIPNAALTSFTSIIVKSFHFDTLATQYLQIPGGAVQFLALIAGGVICTRYPRNSRCITMIVANAICILGAGLLVGLPSSNKWGRLVALWLCFFQGLGFSISLTMVSSNVAGYTKKQLTGAVLFTGYCVGNIIGPQTFKASEAKTGYHSAYVAMLVGYSVKLLMVVILYIYMYSVNKARDRAHAERGELSEEEERDAVEKGMLDVTEIDNPGFSRLGYIKASKTRPKIPLLSEDSKFNGQPSYL